MPESDPADEVLDYEPPTWAGKPPNGMHLDVLKTDKLIQKLMIDEKRFYVFGRNPKLCDFTMDHASCSRAHAVLTYHKFLQRMFLMDLGSTHGTFIGTVRLEPRKPEQLFPAQVFKFGASSRVYILREKPQSASAPPPSSRQMATADDNSMLPSLLPEKEEDLENLTEYNTALNRRISAMAVPSDSISAFSRKRNAKRISFTDEEQIINPEDVDPSVGRFRNLVQTAVISHKRPKVEPRGSGGSTGGNDENAGGAAKAVSGGRPLGSSTLPEFGPISAKLGLSLPSLAPDVDLYAAAFMPPHLAPLPSSGGPSAIGGGVGVEEPEPRKKKYAKEAWPGRKPVHLLM